MGLSPERQPNLPFVTLLTLLEWRVMIQSRAGVNLAWPIDTRVSIFQNFLVIGNPAWHSPDSKNHGEHLYRDTDGAHDNAAVKIDIRIKLALDEIRIFESRLFEVFGDIQQWISH